jgi:hypothetical protein
MAKYPYKKVTPKAAISHAKPPSVTQDEPQAETSTFRRNHPVVVFVMKEIRSIVAGALMLGVGGAGYLKESHDTGSFSSLHLRTVQRLDSLETRMDKAETRLNTIDPPDAAGKAGLTGTNCSEIVNR